jgi:hypothetical protein
LKNNLEDDTCSIIAPDVPFAKMGYLVALVVVSSVTLIKLAMLAVKLLAVPDALVKTTALGVPRSGVTNVGLVANTKEPEPVSSETSVLSSKEVVEANCDKEFAVVANPVAAPT